MGMGDDTTFSEPLRPVGPVFIDGVDEEVAAATMGNEDDVNGAGP